MDGNNPFADLIPQRPQATVPGYIPGRPKQPDALDLSREARAERGDLRADRAAARADAAATRAAEAAERQAAAQARSAQADERKLGQINGDQAKGQMYLGSAVAAVNALNSIRGYKPSIVSGALETLSNNNPLRDSLSQLDRRVLNAQLAFANGAIRLESGAVISDQEIARKARQLFPMEGDGPEVQADKRAQREAALAGMRAVAGPGSRRVPRADPPGGRPAPNNRGFRVIR